MSDVAAPSRASATAWFGTLAADRPARAAPEHGLTAGRQLVDVEEQVDVDAADDAGTHGTR